MNNFHTRRSKKPKSNMKKIIYGVIALLILQYFFYGFFVSPGTDLDNSTTITIESGEGLKSISKKLKKANVINSKFLFLTYAKISDQDTLVKSGTYQIPFPQNIPSALDLLVNTIPGEGRITIPEGYKITQIDSLLTQKGLIQSGDFTNCLEKCGLEHSVIKLAKGKSLEGFLFPDTYFVNITGFTPEVLIYKMLNNFEDKLPEDWESKAYNLPETDFYTVLTMASIIEREVLTDEDKAIVSGILWKRYENDWALQADATSLYLKDDNTITTADLESNSPYNTRNQKGFPPTPISNPGLSSIEAALNPTKTEYWFYLTTLDTGEVKYAATNEQHNANKRKFL